MHPIPSLRARKKVRQEKILVTTEDHSSSSVEKKEPLDSHHPEPVNHRDRSRLGDSGVHAQSLSLLGTQVPRGLIFIHVSQSANRGVVCIPHPDFAATPHANQSLQSFHL